MRALPALHPCRIALLGKDEDPTGLAAEEDATSRVPFLLPYALRPLRRWREASLEPRRRDKALEGSSPITNLFRHCDAAGCDAIRLLPCSFARLLGTVADWEGP